MLLLFLFILLLFVLCVFFFSRGSNLISIGTVELLCYYVCLTYYSDNLLLK